MSDAPRAHRLDFTDHRRELHQNKYVYAVVSRRSRGLSIGINLNPDKVCNFDCPYCQVDRTIPGGTRDVDLDVLEAELGTLLECAKDGSLWTIPPFNTAAPALRRVNDIAFAGDGEPTACPQFAEAVGRVAEIHAKAGISPLHVFLLTNATLFHRPRVQVGLQTLRKLGGVVWAKLDAGTQEYFEKVDGSRLSLDRIQDNILQEARLAPVVLQCLFPAFDGLGPSEPEIAAWASRIQAIVAGGGKIREVQVTTVARRPADPRVGVLPVEALASIASAARALGVEVQVFPGATFAPEAPQVASETPSSPPLETV